METLRILDPCCGAGEALAQLAERLRHDSGVSIQTHGVELHTERAEQAAERLDHALFRRPVPNEHSQPRLRPLPLESPLRLGVG